MKERLQHNFNQRYLLVFNALISLLLYLLPSPPPLPTVIAKEGPNPIQIENQLPGTTDWQLSNPAPYNKKTFHYPAIEGYAWTTSAQEGDTVAFSVSTTARSFRVDVYRMGWYQGTGGRYITSISSLPGHTYPIPAPDHNTGLVALNWPVSFTLATDDYWTTGMYMLKLTASSGFQSYIPLVIRSPQPADFAFFHASNTDEAYNTWGGASLYSDETNTLKAQRAFKVSFDRPFQQNTGAGQFFWWEYPMVRWLEKNGYDVSYFSDLDMQNLPYPLQNYHALLIVGHDEYWSQQMREHLTDAVTSGANLAVFAANTVYWQIRYEPRPTGSLPLPERVIVCYKDATVDPLSGKENNLVTVQFRDNPLDDPEQTLIGAMYSGYFSDSRPDFPWVVADPSSWIFAGTGLKKGDALPGLVGYEYDKVHSNYAEAPGVHILSASPVINTFGQHDISNSTLYTATSGAQVFDAGTIEWSWGLDDSSLIAGTKVVNQAAQKITANILNRFRIRPVPVAKAIPARPYTSPPTPRVVTPYIVITGLFILILASLFFVLYRFGAFRRIKRTPQENSHDT